MLFTRPGHVLKVAAGALMSAALLSASALAAEPAAAASHRAAADAPSASRDSARQDAHAGSAPCFFRRDWKGGWKATRDGRTIYIPVSGSIYRLDLAGPYRILRDPWAILSNKESIDTICSPLDFRLTVTNQAGIVQAPIVTKMTRLTPEQAAALPKNLRP